MCKIMDFDAIIDVLLVSKSLKSFIRVENILYLIKLNWHIISRHLKQYSVLTLFLLNVSNHNVRLQIDHFIEPQFIPRSLYIWQQILFS